jgi:hypothetical protein
MPDPRKDAKEILRAASHDIIDGHAGLKQIDALILGVQRIEQLERLLGKIWIVNGDPTVRRWIDETL